MPKMDKQRLWRILRRGFRWCRIVFLLLILLGVGAFIYLNRVGLPNFLKTRLLTELRSHGLELEFQRVRLRWYEGIVAEGVRLGPTGQTNGPQLRLQEVQLRLNANALKQRRLQIDSLLLTQGRLLVPLTSSNAPALPLAIEGIHTELHFRPGDLWELDQFQAQCLGANLHLAGTVTNAGFLRQLPTARGTNQPALVWQNPLIKVREWAGKFHFQTPPDIFLTINGDARDTNSFTADLKFDAGRAATPWGELEKMLLTSSYQSNGVVKADLKLTLDQLKTEWGQAGHARLSLRATQSVTNPVPLQADWEVQLRDTQTRWGRAAQLHISGQTTQQTNEPVSLKTRLTVSAAKVQTEQWGSTDTVRLFGTMTHAPTNFIPWEADYDLTLGQPQTPWAKSERAQISGRFEKAGAGIRAQADAGWAGWAELEPFRVNWECRLTQLEAGKIQAQKLFFAGQWRAPELVIPQFAAELYGGHWDGALQLDVATRALAVKSFLDFDPHQIGHLFDTNSQHTLQQFTWQAPPRINAAAKLILPAWTNTQPAQWAETWRAASLAGDVKLGPCGWRDIKLLSLATPFTYSNSVWRLPQLAIQRPEGPTDLSFTTDLANGDFQAGFRLPVDPQLVKPFLKTKDALTVYDFFQFTSLPAIQGELWGRWDDLERLGVNAQLAVTNFVFRGAAFSRFATALQFTNQYFNFSGIDITRGDERITTPSAGIDLRLSRLYVTNVLSTMNPYVATSVIGPETRAAIEPYRFAKPPTVRLNGSMHLSDISVTDLHFEIAGGPFSYWKFNLPAVTGSVHWVTNTLTITNVQADFYGGKLKWDGFFDFAKVVSTDFRFKGDFTDAKMDLLMKDLVSSTNRSEGILTGSLNVTAANSDDWKSWQGYGYATLHDGFLWDVPMFGVFSSILNTVRPGLGSSRASRGTATYTITDSVIETRDLELFEPTMRLRYEGTVDFDGVVNARVEADLFRNTWFVGRIVSLALLPFTKLFEYKVTGTLNDPKTEPLYFLPKVMLFPLHPFRTLKGLFGGDETKPAPAKPTPAPPP